MTTTFHPEGPGEGWPDDEQRARAFFAGGFDTTMRSNRAAWERLALAPRILRGIGTVDASTRLLGIRLEAPILFAPVSSLGLAHSDGEVAVARAARAAGLGLVLSSEPSRSIPEVTAVSGPYLQQVYLPERRETMTGFLQEAVTHGAAAIVFTVDQTSVGGQPGFRDAIYDPRLQNQRARSGGHGSAKLATAPDLRWDDIAWLRRTTGLPVVVKGVLRPDDARRCLDAGAAGIVVSNHGGRQLSGAVATATALPGIRAAVGPDVPVLVDSGIRTGEDVLRALALGADGVLVGHPVAEHLLDGPDALLAYARGLRRGFERVCALCGVRTPAEIGPDLLALPADAHRWSWSTRGASHSVT